jgi:hypothetical protein
MENPFLFASNLYATTYTDKIFNILINNNNKKSNYRTLTGIMFDAVRTGPIYHAHTITP